MRARIRWQLLTVMLLVIAVVTATLTSSAAANGGPPDGNDIDVVLTLLHSNDGESALLETEADDEQLYGGIAPFASVVRDLRREATHQACFFLCP